MYRRQWRDIGVDRILRAQVSKCTAWHIAQALVPSYPVDLLSRMGGILRMDSAAVFGRVAAGRRVHQRIGPGASGWCDCRIFAVGVLAQLLNAVGHG